MACGDGFFLNSVKSLVKRGLGFDINQENIQKDNIIFVKQNFDDFFRLNKEKYDVLTAFHFLEHIWDVRKFFMVVREHLLDNGLLVLGLPDSSQKFLQDDILNFPPHHMGWWSKSSLKKVASYFGFDFVDTFYVSADKLHIDKKAFWIKNSSSSFFNNLISKFYYKIGMLLPNLLRGNTFIGVFKKCGYENS